MIEAGGKFFSIDGPCFIGYKKLTISTHYLLNIVILQ